jgi:hypothetical protein
MCTGRPPFFPRTHRCFAPGAATLRPPRGAMHERIGQCFSHPTSYQPPLLVTSVPIGLISGKPLIVLLVQYPFSLKITL